MFSNFSAWKDTTKDTYANNQALHQVNTLNTPYANAPMVHPELWFTAWTKAGKKASYPFKLKVCGAESLIYNSTAVHYYVFDKWSGTQTVNAN